MTTADDNRLDEERWRRLARSLSAAMAHEVPGWTDQREGDPGATLVEVFAFLGEQLLFRSSALPDRLRTRLFEVIATLALHRPPGAAAGSVEQFMGEKRVNYFDGQVLSAADFRSEQQYCLGRQRRHNKTLHGTGVVNGLRVKADSTSPGTIVVEPGLAIDAHGREVVLMDRVTLTASGTSPLFTVVSYLERETDLVPTPGGTTASRIEEGVGVALAETETAADGVAIARVVPQETGWNVDPAFVPRRVRH